MSFCTPLRLSSKEVYNLSRIQVTPHKYLCKSEIQKFSATVEPQDLSPSSETFAIRSYPKRVQIPTNLPKIHFNNILS
jgi:hypothetical protein